MQFARYSLLVALAFFQPLIGLADDDFPFDDFFFHWAVVKSGKSKLSVDKDQDRTVLTIRADRDSLDFTPEEGVELAKTLSKTQEMAKKLKGQKNKQDTVKSGELEVTFSSTDGIFLVAVTRPGKKEDKTVVLERDAAVAISKALKKSVELVALVDKKIDL